SM
ncbi:hypothetical protein D047_0617B, partial [Vibrio parahaemolyticus VPTS-2010_2]